MQFGFSPFASGPGFRMPPGFGGGGSPPPAQGASGNGDGDTPFVTVTNQGARVAGDLGPVAIDLSFRNPFGSDGKAPDTHEAVVNNPPSTASGPSDGTKTLLGVSAAIAVARLLKFI